MLKKLKLLKKPLFQKRRWTCDFPPRKTLVAQEHHAISRQEKMAFSTPVGLSWDFPPPPTESVRTDGRTDVRTDGHVTITSEPKFLGLIVYQISLAMELHWRALPAGSAIKQMALPSIWLNNLENTLPIHLEPLSAKSTVLSTV